MLPTEPAPQPPPAAAPPPAGNRPGLLGTIVETARETGRAVLREEAVGPLLEVLLAKLCSAPVRQAIEQHAAEALHAALQASVEVLPEDARGGALDAQLARAEDTARRLLADSLAEAFSPAARAELQQELERAMQAALDTDADAARTYTERAAHAVLLHVLVVFHRHWAQLLRVLLPLFVTAVQQAVTTKAKEQVTERAPAPRPQLAGQGPGRPRSPPGARGRPPAAAGPGGRAPRRGQ